MVCVAAAFPAFAPTPDFRYVGLEPVTAPRLGAAATAIGLGAGVTLAMSGLDTRQALVAGVLATILSACTLRGAGAPSLAPSGTRMAIVPWGVLVETVEAPRILRWAAVRSIDVETSRGHPLLAGPSVSSRVAIETWHDRFVGQALGAVSLERLVENVTAYASEQCSAVALDLTGDGALPDSLEVVEPACEALLAAARDWLQTGAAAAHLGLPAGGYRRASVLASTPRSIDVLRRILRDRTPKPADPRAFAAVVAAELHARELLPELESLTQCPHPIVAAVARQAARKLGASRARTGTLEEVAPFLFEADRSRLEDWLKS